MSLESNPAQPTPPNLDTLHGRASERMPARSAASSYSQACSPRDTCRSNPEAHLTLVPIDYWSDFVYPKLAPMLSVSFVVKTTEQSLARSWRHEDSARKSPQPAPPTYRPVLGQGRWSVGYRRLHPHAGLCGPFRGRKRNKRAFFERKGLCPLFYWGLIAVAK